MSENVFIVYDWPEGSSVSLDLETNRCTIRIAAGEPDPGGVVQRAMETIRERGWATV